jgi:hypothetical protein
MKWFKHLSDADSDEFLVDLMAEYGYAGKGRWWSIVGLIAGQMKKGSSKCEFEMAVREWTHFLRLQPKQLLDFFLFLATNKHSNVTILCSIGGATLSFQSDFKVISKSTQSKLKLNFRAPKMLELRDTRNTNKPTVGTIEVEVEVDKENKKKTATPKAKKGTPVKMPKEVIKAWENLKGQKLPENRWTVYAITKGVKVDLFPIFEDFCTHHKKKGSVWVSWYAAWQKWIQNAEKWSPEYFKEPKQAASSWQDKVEKIEAMTAAFILWVLEKQRSRDAIMKNWNHYTELTNKIIMGFGIDWDKTIELHNNKFGGLLNG